MWTRRNLLLTSGLAAGGMALPATPAFAADEYDTLRARWLLMINGSGYDPTAEPFRTALDWLAADAAAYHAAMSPSTTPIWSDLPLGTVSANLNSTFRRITVLATAYATPGTGVTASPALHADILAALDNLITHHYTVGNTEYNNWWHWRIGIPQTLQDTMVLLYDTLGPSRIAACNTAVAHHVPASAVSAYTGVSTGANRVDLCRVLALRGVLSKDSATLALARDALSPTFPLVRSGDGFYTDGSFLQHTVVPYTGTYGAVLLDGFARIFALLAGSSWAVNDPARATVFSAVEQSFAPFLFNGLMMDGQSGRGISRGLSVTDPHQLQGDDHRRGHGIISAILQLAQAAPAADAARWRALAKGWLSRDYWSPPMADLSQSIPALARFQAVLADTSVTAVAEPVDSQVFAAMDRAVHRRPGWAFAVSLCSARTTYYETGNGENLRGWHTSNGMTYWWGANYGNGQYSDAYWPTVDPYRLPGITVSRVGLADAAGGSWGAAKPAATFAGGATDGRSSVLGQDTRALNSTLQARKSWFCLDDQVVCLGAGISATDGAVVETTVDNRNLGAGAANGAFTVNGTAQPTTLGWDATLTGTQWAALAGFGGYIFPAGATIRARREQRTGSWRDINTGGATTPVSRKYLTMWLDHGVNPSGATYSYVLLPGATASATAARAAAPTVTVLSNTPSVQAISDTATGVTAANFFAAGSAGPITVSAPCSVLMRENGGTLSVSVADPTRAAATVTVTIARAGFTTATIPAQVSVVGLDPLTMVVEVGGTLGASRTVTFGTGAPIAAGPVAAHAPAADAYVRDGTYATTNYGADTQLVVKNAGVGYLRRAFLRFDLTALPAAPRRAVLWVRGATADSGGTQAVVTAYAVSDTTWSETAITWNSQPALGTQLSAAPIGDAEDWIALDVTAHIQARHAAGGLATIALAQSAPGNAVVLRSRNNPTNPPFLQLVTDA